MNQAPHLRLEQLFDAAMDLAPAEQAAFLDRECAGDQQMREQLRELLHADRQSTAPPLRIPAPQIPSVGARDPSEPANPHGRTVTAPPGQPSPPASSLPAPGDWIAQYQIIRELGRGGMGAVFLARDTKLARRVAIKFLSTPNPQATERFIIEARTTAQFTHENIVVIHDVDEYRESPFMVLEYVEGRPLGQLIDGRRLPGHRAIELIIPVVRALVCAHDHGIVHRDLKPDNIIVTDTGAIKVLDFGIAKLCQPAAPALGSLPAAPALRDAVRPADFAATSPGALLGTLPYMSPEQWRSTDEVDHQTDIWAVGIILFQMLVGHHPLRPENGEDLVITSELDQPMPRVRDSGVDVPQELARIVEECLAKRKHQRIARARDLLRALEALLPARHRPLDASESPYPGLLSFEEKDAHRYFGRASEVANILARLRARALVGIAGPTGIGKSSFVRAGVIPALKDSGEAWEPLIVRPGRDPFGALSALLLPMITAQPGSVHPEPANAASELSNRLRQEPGYLGSLLRTRALEHNSRIVLIIDPFEELYTLSADLSERKAFTRCLAGVADDPVSPLRVVVSIRSDFLDRVAEDSPFMTELTAGLMFLSPPSRANLRDALTHPAQLAGYRFESPDMVENILDDLENASGSLPLLQFAATRLWADRDPDEHTLTRHGYTAIGGLVGALASHADQVVDTLARLSPGAHALVQAIFRRLVTPERTRALTPLAELSELSERPDDVQALLDQLIDARLLIVHPGEEHTGALVEIVHDALIHRWPRLRRWLDESADDAAFLHQLRTAARQWQQKHRASGLLWRGDTVDEARRFNGRYRGHLSGLERDYLHATFALADRALRRKRWLIAGTMGFLVLVSAAALVAFLMIRQAERRAKNQAIEAERARAQLETQLDVVKREKRQRQQAETRADSFSARARQTGAELDQAQVALQHKIEELQAAKQHAEDESLKARSAQREAEAARALAEAETARARTAADDARRANQSLNHKLEQERSRNQKLERKAGKINRTLK